MNFLEALEEAKKGKKVRCNSWFNTIYLTIKNDEINIHNDVVDYLTQKDYQSDKWEIAKEILDDEEKQYLENIIKPFKKRVHAISKVFCSLDYDYIRIDVNPELPSKHMECIKLPAFRKTTMYKKMVENAMYSLGELDLDD